MNKLDLYFYAVITRKDFIIKIYNICTCIKECVQIVTFRHFHSTTVHQNYNGFAIYAYCFVII